MKRRTTILLMLIITLSITLFIPSYAYAAPSSQVWRDPDIANYINFDDSVDETIYFKNSADSSLDDVASTIQYITLAAANLNPSSASIELEASWEIYDPDDNLRASGTVTSPLPIPEIFSPYSTTIPVDIYTWNLGPPSDTLDIYTDYIEFEDDNTLRILRPQEYLILTITINCEGDGDSRIVFFFRATEHEPDPDDIPIKEIDDTEKGIPLPERMNIYYQDEELPIRPIGWWPLHNSYDPYDSDINTGHRFEQVGTAPLRGWTRDPTTTAFSKANKMVHQMAIPPAELGTIHICGFKFTDLNRNGIWDERFEPKISGVTITLLGEDGVTLAQEYYEGDFNILGENPEETGDDGLIGHYCFNLEDVIPGTYIFYVQETVPEGNIPTTPTIIGPIILEVGPGEEVYSSGNIFGNASPIPVGGTLLPLDLVQLTISWIILGVLISLITISFTMVGKKK
ncbi:MAG: hypothetical protein H3Z50_08000 [archaeon]|nr:hypothetical protein [archaeon]MCP8306409.1 hypothetical protein [archaeon]